MSYKHLNVSTAEAHWNATGTRILKYSLEMYHEGLKEHKIISAPELDILQNKVNLQAQKWMEKWDVIETKQRKYAQMEASISEAQMRTAEAETAVRAIENLLLHTLSVDDSVNWDSLKKKDNFSEDCPVKPQPKPKKSYPEQPEKEVPVFSLMERIFKSKKERKIKQYNDLFAVSILSWEKVKSEIDIYNQSIEQEHQLELQKWNERVEEWTRSKNEFLKLQEEFNVKIDHLKESYYNLNSDSILEYCDMVLNNSDYPDTFPKNYELEYIPESKILIIEYELPSIDSMPTIKEVKYIASKKELKETYYPESYTQKLFDETLYKITLRTIHEIFEADAANAIDAVSFNGWVEAINKATGKLENNCILTIQIKKIDFIKVDLANVDPKICFRKFKGVASSKLSTLTPIQPLLQISKQDKRFIEGYEVANQIDSTTNLAAMNWEDFEHLIRQLFEKEFLSNGGEVRVTQASRDGGVDVVAFDPDPIRGGKIIIQAKRYTNTVSVSAVRDLYGTVVNEGATKGILVSTADYGPDAYEFAKGKPITLLNGSNLLHLLEKHGHRAKIDLREAKKIIAENKK
ncbi:restriction endonuclease [Paenibacillus abyssi]|uniref:Restriction endonuclease n=1 Tax=Paenibacillus abyssi TaxID=1340531 RepID=A0A917G720_9BACL|nr:restriction endonuclease [Paenibacillus abyssi]GGG25410.1 restriction endonuclease [Paenibacillus abyssi]